jgi:hypothetical protein
MERVNFVIQDLGDQILTDAQQEVPIGGGEFSPYDPHPGALLESGRAEAITRPAVVGVRVSFGGLGSESEAYALYQEESDEYRHTGGQKAHFERDAVQRAVDDYPYIVARAVAEALDEFR